MQKKCCKNYSVSTMDPPTANTSLWKHRNVLIIITSGIFLTTGIYLEFVVREEFIGEILFLFAAAIPWGVIAKHGFSSLLQKKISMDLLIMIAAAGAFLIGHGEEGAAVVLLFFTAEFLEEYATERAKKSIGKLLELAPEIATIKKQDKEVQIPTSKVKVGDILIIKPGDRIPLDGIIIKGTSSVNQASITGESVPVMKTEGDEVFAGTINEEGYLEVKVTKRSTETMLSKIVKLVEKAQQQKSETERFIDRFAKYYTPSVITLALFVAAFPVVFLKMSPDAWIYKALVLLVVSCPCALAISTPVSMVSAITSAARNGVLIKGSSYIEEIKRVRVLAIDKTGTITVGRLEVTDVIPLKGSWKKLLQASASIEALSKHPIARAIVKFAQKGNVKLKNVENFESIAGKGVTGKIGKTRYYIGNKNFIKGLGIQLPETEIKRLESEGKTVIVISQDKKCLGIIALMDQIRQNAVKMVEDLKRRGVKTVMLTGDNETIAKTIAKKIKIDDFYSELLPQEKVKIIKELSRKHKHVSMIGDGVNDAPALAEAHVGIAMGAIGSDAAIETADIALMRDDLSKVNYLFKLSEKTMNVIKQNIFASILIKGSFAVLTFPGLITLWLAVAVGDMGLSLAVILNALRLSRVK